MEENKNNLNNKDDDNIELVDSISDKISVDYEINPDNYKINTLGENNNKSPNNSKNISKRKINQVITLDTVIYEMFGFKENKNRNYDKISIEIKKIEQKNEIEKEKLKKKINKLSKKIKDKEAYKLKEKKNIENKDNIENGDNDDEELVIDKLNLQSKKLELMEYAKDKKLNYIELIQKLKIPPEQRTIRDILRIKTYVENSNLGKNFKEEFLDINLYEKLIYFCCIEMRYEKFQKDDIIYKVGDPPISFYSIIFGSVNILKPISKHEYLSGFQYFNYLMNLRKKKEIYIFHKNIKYNIINYHIDPIHADIIHYIYLLNYLEIIKNRKDSELFLDKVFDLIDIKPEFFGINPSKINSVLYLNNNIKLIKKKLPPISEETIQKYSFFNNYIIKKDVIIYEYNNISSLKGNDYFGDIYIEKHSVRESSAIAENETEVAFLPIKLYYIQIGSLKAALFEKKINNLYSNYFFKKINYKKFERIYFKLFTNEKYSKGDVLFKEGDKIDYLYFILEGSVQLYSTQSMNEIEELINILLEKKESLDNNNNNNTLDNSNYIYSQLNTESNDLVKYLNKKQQNKLINLHSNEDAGIISFLIGGNYLATCVIDSNNAKIYKIDVHNMNLILREENEAKKQLFKRIKKKLELLSERLYKINNFKLIKLDNEITLENLKKRKILEQNKRDSNKSFINYDKIYNLINDNNNSNNSNYNLNQNIETINLPPIFNNRKNNINSSFNNNEETVDINLKKSNLYKKKGLFHNGTGLNMALNINNYRRLKINNTNEDKMLSRLRKNIKSFIGNKYILSSETKKLSHLYEENKKSNNINKSIRNIGDLSNIKDDIYITQLPNSNSNRKIEEKELFNELFGNSKNTNINTLPNSSPNVEKMNINKSIERSLNIERPLYIKNSNIINFDLRAQSNDFKNINIFRDKSIDELNIINQKKDPKYNKPFCEPNTLVKKERYKIFEYSDLCKKIESNYIQTKLQRIKDMKNLHSKFSMYK